MERCVTNLNYQDKSGEFEDGQNKKSSKCVVAILRHELLHT